MHCRSCTAHCPRAVWQCIAEVTLPTAHCPQVQCSEHTAHPIGGASLEPASYQRQPHGTRSAVRRSHQTPILLPFAVQSTAGDWKGHPAIRPAFHIVPCPPPRPPRVGRSVCSFRTLSPPPPPPYICWLEWVACAALALFWFVFWEHIPVVCPLLSPPRHYACVGMGVHVPPTPNPCARTQTEAPRMTRRQPSDPQPLPRCVGGPV